ncbi:MAG: S-methyl-5'-thioinosine phosphorylase [Gammaproteobacteria bacterium]|nr:S-methyl-5'-thioinosine phosphorylase [Gammaproteobacteria bacterium]
MRLGIIGGTGSTGLFAGGVPIPLAPGPWGATSGSLERCQVHGHELIVLSRHGVAGTSAIAPHRVNYRANLWALREAGVDHVLGINTVGGITQATAPGRLVIPDQLIDYTWGREHTYTGDSRFPLRHVEFTEPFSAPLRDKLLVVARGLGLDVLSEATYGVTQGPRLESAAEIDRLERDGCHVVGMTAMPEAGLARELKLSYAICCVVVNRAAGRAPPGLGIHAEIAVSLAIGMEHVRRLVTRLVATD